MAFRADEEISRGLDRVSEYLIPRTFEPEQRERSQMALEKIIEEIGPAVEGYPSWHPLVSKHDGRNPETSPNKQCGYHGLDHTRYFAHGFITCPYSFGADEVIESVEKLDHHCATISAEILDVPFYSTETKAILVRCEWNKPLNGNKMIGKHIAVPLMLEQELPCWRWSERAESWDVMRPYLLGAPHGSRSSLFVDQETALAMKKAYMAMVESGMFGPLKNK